MFEKPPGRNENNSQNRGERLKDEVYLYKLYVFIYIYIYRVANLAMNQSQTLETMYIPLHHLRFCFRILFREQICKLDIYTSSISCQAPDSQHTRHPPQVPPMIHRFRQGTATKTADSGRRKAAIFPWQHNTFVGGFRDIWSEVFLIIWGVLFGMIYII